MLPGGFPACALALAVLANFLSGIQTKCLLAHIFPLFKRVSRGNFAVSQTVRLRLRTAWREGPLHDQCTARSFGLVAVRGRAALPAGTPAISSRHFSPNAENQPALLSETPHPCRHSLRALISAGWREGRRASCLFGVLIAAICVVTWVNLRNPKPAGTALSHRAFPPFRPRRHDVYYFRVSPAVSRMAFHNTEALRTQHTHPIKERGAADENLATCALAEPRHSPRAREGRDSGTKKLKVSPVLFQSTRP